MSLLIDFAGVKETEEKDKHRLSKHTFQLRTRGGHK